LVFFSEWLGLCLQTEIKHCAASTPTLLLNRLDNRSVIRHGSDVPSDIAYTTVPASGEVQREQIKESGWACALFIKSFLKQDSGARGAIGLTS